MSRPVLRPRSSSRKPSGSRPHLLRGVLLGVGLVVVIGLVSVVALRATVERRLAAVVDRVESNWGSLDPATLAPPEVEEASNRARYLRHALEALDTEVQPGDWVLFGDFVSLRPGGPDERGVRAATGLVDRNARALELLDAAARMPASNWRVSYEEGIAATIPRVNDLMRLSRINAARALLALHAGRTEEALRRVEEGFAVAESLAAEPLLSAQTARLNVQQIHLGVLRSILFAGEPGEEDLRRLDEVLVRASRPDAIHTGLLGDLRAHYHLFERVEGSRRHEARTDTRPVLGKVFGWAFRPFFRDDERFYLERMDETLEYQSLPRYQRAQRFSEPPYEAEPRGYHHVSRSALPAYGDWIDRGDRAAARLAVARLAVALRRHRLAEGTYPDIAEALVPATLDRLPVDPFTGEPPEYTRQVTGFLVRSAAEGTGDPAGERLDGVLRWEIPR